MAIIPTIRCRNIRASVQFYTQVLDFRRADDDDLTDPAHVVLRRAGDTIFLSSHAGDGAFGQHVVVMTEDVDVIVRSIMDLRTRAGERACSLWTIRMATRCASLKSRAPDTRNDL
jgi:catechol 2,3-dioxygenase-like lactoylglutathione lyase family enzyme